MTRKLLVEVLPEDIAAGCPQDCCYCPLAHALHRITGDLSASVGTRWIFWHHHGELMRATMPDWVSRVVMEYDKTKYMRPIKFKVVGHNA